MGGRRISTKIIAYKRLQSLQGKSIPRLLGEGFFNDRPSIILSEIVGMPLHQLARDDTIEVDEEALQAGLLDSFRTLFVKEAKYWDQRLDDFLFRLDREYDQGRVVIVDLEQVMFPEESLPWEESSQIREESMNFGTACSLMRAFRQIKRATPLGWTSGCVGCNHEGTIRCEENGDLLIINL